MQSAQLYASVAAYLLALAHDQKVPNPISSFAPAIAQSTFKLAWQYAVSRYRNDLNVYVWRPFAREPKLERAEIFLQPARIDLNTLLIIFTSSENSTRLIDGYRSKRASVLPYSVSRVHNAKRDVAISLYVVYMQLIEDTGVFLTSLRNAVARLVTPLRGLLVIVKLMFTPEIFGTDCSIGQ